MSENLEEVYISKVNQYHYEPGYIFKVPNERADILVTEMKAVRVDFPQLSRHEKKIIELYEDLERKKQDIQGNIRLSDIGRREELQELQEKYESEIRLEEKAYLQAIEILIKQTREENSRSFISTEDVDPYQVKQEAGIHMSELIMKPDVTSIRSYIWVH